MAGRVFRLVPPSAGDKEPVFGEGLCRREWVELSLFRQPPGACRPRRNVFVFCVSRPFF